MNRGARAALGAAAAFAAALSVTACGRDGTPDGRTGAAQQGRAAAASLTTPATRPVVTVYKSPT